MARISNRDARGPISRRADFDTHGGNFYGRTQRPGLLAYVRAPGYLSEHFTESLDDADYIVWSYNTPIGWHIPDKGWIVPEVNYSATTSTRHQPVLRSAVWDEITPRPSWVRIPGSPVAQEILRQVRAGFPVDIAGRSARVIDLVIATGEVAIVGASLVPTAGKANS